MENCVLCGQNLDSGEKTVIPPQRGRDTINNASVQRGDGICITEGQAVHEHCRRTYTNKHNISSFLKKQQAESEVKPSQALRSKNNVFDFRRCCLFCGRDAELDGKTVWPVRTLDFQKSITKSCLERADEWAEKVKGRLEFVSDLPAADAVYHQTCSANFRTKRKIPKSFALEPEPKKVKYGRPKDEGRVEAFRKVAAFLQENDSEQITINDLISMMGELTGGNPYCFKKMKEELVKLFGEEIIIAEVDGKPNVATFRKTASSILHAFYSAPDTDDEEAQKIAVIKAAAELIKSDIKSIPVSRKTYPSPDDVASVSANVDFVPKSLQLLLDTVYSGKDCDLRIASIGQAIMQAARPRLLITPLQIGLGVQVHHNFESQFLVDLLYSLGFCSSYKEVRTYELSAAATQELKLPTDDNHFVQYMADNVDHNSATLDGMNTFHGMGMIAAITPSVQDREAVPRNTDVKLEEVVRKARVDIRYYKEETIGMLNLKFEKLNTVFTSDPTKEIEILWKTSWLLLPQRPSWSGVMQTVHAGDFPGQTSFFFLPLIDLNPSDKTCIYSTLLFICGEAKRNGRTPIITFDQPLWWKALAIIMSEPETSDLRSIVLRLGPFHMEMSFLACIGHLMAGTGLQEALSVIYAPNAVSAMLQGKAVTRAVRGHLLMDTALNALLASDTFHAPLPQLEVGEEGERSCDETCSVPQLTTMFAQSSPESVSATDTQEKYQADQTCELGTEQKLVHVSMEDVPQDVKAAVKSSLTENVDALLDNTDPHFLEAIETYKKLMEGDLSLNELGNIESICNISKKLEAHKMTLNSRTSVLWLQYMSMIDILKTFIKAERTGNWLLHLSTVQDMLPYLAAAGHNLYTKSAHLYLQMMNKLPDTHPVVYKSFLDGHHVVRRSKRFWAGLSSDFAIEQVLMRSIKSAGGLTRGRGMSESQRATWLLSMPACAEINSAMQEVTCTLRLSSEQHKEMGPARVAKDAQDVMTLTSFLNQHSPFADDPSLRNVITGVVAEASVNVDGAKQIGLHILKTMEGQTASDASLKRKDKAVTMNVKSSIRIDETAVTVDPQLLFQRLVAAASNLYEDKTEVFNYELCSFPSSLFESPGFLLQPNKAALANELWKMVKNTENQPQQTSPQFVLDGGSLLQRIPWRRGTTFRDIIETYVCFIKGKYPNATVVFDGYISGPSTKDITHLKRGKGMKGQAVHFALDMMLQFSKEQFLCNVENKQRFIYALGSALESFCTVIHAKSDADLTIVLTATKCARHQVTAVIGEDTDILVLLAYHADSNDHDIFFYSDKQGGKSRCWNIKHLIHELGENRHLLLSLHSLTGCDTTSRPFGIGKGTALQKLLKNVELRSLADAFLQQRTQEDVVEIGEKALVLLYNGCSGETLNHLRHRLFCMKVATGTTYIQVHSLPPTSAAARFHSQRVYLQVQQWMDGDTVLKPAEWGWQIENGLYVPRMTDLPAAPAKLLKVIRCTCKENCDSKRCSCKKHGLLCSPGCGECHGVSCFNSPAVCFD